MNENGQTPIVNVAIGDEIEFTTLVRGAQRIHAGRVLSFDDKTICVVVDGINDFDQHEQRIHWVKR